MITNVKNVKAKTIITSLILLIMTITMSISVYADEPKHVIDVTYTSLGVPNINSSFKTWMDYRCVTDRRSPQYNYIHTWGWTDDQGFMRASGERDLGITDDYYMVALGSYYGSGIGTKYRITTTTGRVFYAVLCDQKANMHTNSTHQYASHNDIVEFIVNTSCLNRDVKSAGSANVYMPLNGPIASIERIDFIRGEYIPEPEPEVVEDVQEEKTNYAELRNNCFNQ